MDITKQIKAAVEGLNTPQKLKKADKCIKEAKEVKPVGRPKPSPPVEVKRYRETVKAVKGVRGRGTSATAKDLLDRRVAYYEKEYGKLSKEQIKEIFKDEIQKIADKEKIEAKGVSPLEPKEEPKEPKEEPKEPKKEPLEPQKKEGVVSTKKPASRATLERYLTPAQATRYLEAIDKRDKGEKLTDKEKKDISDLKAVYNARRQEMKGSGREERKSLRQNLVLQLIRPTNKMVGESNVNTRDF